MGVINLWILIQIFRNKKVANPVHSGLLLYLMPLNFTLMFLFYTESASLTSILMLYYGVTCAKAPGIVNLLFGIISLVMRQTNIIWANYTVVVILISQTSSKSKK